MPGLTPELVQAFIDSQLERVRALGYEVESCLVDSGDTAEAVLKETLGKRQYDCVMIGAGLRTSGAVCSHLRGFSNLIHMHAPNAKIWLPHNICGSGPAVGLTTPRGTHGIYRCTGVHTRRHAMVFRSCAKPFKPAKDAIYSGMPPRRCLGRDRRTPEWS